MAKDKFKKEEIPVDPWHTFMSAVTQTKLPIFVCCYFDSKGEFQIKANGKILTLLGGLASATEFFKAQMYKNWEGVLAKNGQ